MQGQRDILGIHQAAGRIFGEFQQLPDLGARFVLHLMQDFLRGLVLELRQDVGRLVRRHLLHDVGRFFGLQRFQNAGLDFGVDFGERFGGYFAVDGFENGLAVVGAEILHNVR